MINFRYHIVSLMAVFLALAVGIVLGVTLVSGEANKGLAAQADQDRKQVQIYRDQLYQQQALTEYRDRWAAQIGPELTTNMLSGDNVALVSMPGAPSSIVASLRTAIGDAGGEVVSTTTVSADVFDATRDEATLDAINPFRSQFDAQAAVSTKVGTLLGKALLAPSVGNVDGQVMRIRSALTGGGLVQISADEPEQATLVVVVTAEASDPGPELSTLVEHVDFDLALKQAGVGIVLAGPNSSRVDGTDVAEARQLGSARDTVSTVDVADLPSGVLTVVMAGRQQLLGSYGHHYGAAPSSDAPAPQLPIN